jgi:NhaP-type Na+/H+ or K+/H+ antiporter
VDRITYAAFGAVFGCLLGLVCWWLYGLAMSRHFTGPRLLPAALPWMKVFAGVFAAIGFIFKDKVGSAIGGLLAGILNFEAGHQPKEQHLSWPQVLLVLAVLGFVTWYIFK